MVSYNQIFPVACHGSAWAHNATIVGEVDLYTGANIWYNAIVRGDLGPVHIGYNSTVGERAVILSGKNPVGTITYTTFLGSHVIIGKGAVVDNGYIEDYGKLIRVILFSF